MSLYKHEEKLNTFSHALAIPFFIIGFILLLAKSQHKTAYSTFAIVVYSCSAILLFFASTAYHWVKHPSLKTKFRILDHISIYFLIAGTYTPVCLITLEEGHGWSIFVVVWALTGVGTILKLFFTGKYEVVSLLLYVVMGWLIVWDLEALLSKIAERGLYLLLLGGAFYTLGIVFYAVRKIPYNHFIWHLFVLGGALSHWFLIYLVIV